MYLLEDILQENKNDWVQNLFSWLDDGDESALQSLIQKFSKKQNNQDIKVLYRWVGNHSNSIMWLDEPEYNPLRRVESWSKDPKTISGLNFKKNELIYCLKYEPKIKEVILDLNKIPEYKDCFAATEQEVILQYAKMPIKVEIIQEVTYK